MAGRVATRGDETDKIETSTLVQSADRGLGARYAVGEHTFNPIRGRAIADAWITFVNHGFIAHTIAAIDGTFETGRLKMAESTSLKIVEPGTYRYACKEHPGNWRAHHRVSAWRPHSL